MDVNYATLKANVFADVLTALGTLPTEGQAIVFSAIDKMVLKMKDVVRLAAVDLQDFARDHGRQMDERAPGA